MKVYTRRGDSGETDLMGGPRVAKDHLRVEAYGAVDEVNAALGVCRAATPHADLGELLQRIQGELFALGAVLAFPDPSRREKSGIVGPGAEEVAFLEQRIDAFDKELAPLRRFVLPGGSPPAAACHVARTQCRRAERRLVALDRAEPVDPVALGYLNRLSDLLFVLARLENARADQPDLEWLGRQG
ncbi:MAG: cob(I)yrinic acid a,c-diamide adenosyltransferase [Myxococcota bacterium]